MMTILAAQQLLQSDHVKLRAVEPGDISFLFQMENDSQVWCAGNTITPFSKYQIEQYVYTTAHDIYSEKQLRLMIETLEPEGSPVGIVDIFDFDPHHLRAGIGIIIVPGQRSKGYATEVVEIVKRYSREILQLHQLYCTVIKGNEASIRLFENAGFELTGIRKDWRHQNNTWMDELVFQFIF